ncbi:MULTISPECIES: helix-turn-helix domain-containing protein [Oerskovia]|uniref:HTH-type transcriptional regulator CdhR n=1 Tax=Oerskovia enterophila TaxID=43678 RepID=A0A163RHZ5_9CELL|nr:MULTISPECIES: helix-turn-helix domain-containing protein [Oerskovia]KRC35458.1 AraC family transcriptional regulator [Oerskovia sp. Root22]KZM35231.1 HTH-type transcriptional regulator CdhR [Oerskovia enterophila]
MLRTVAAVVADGLAPFEFGVVCEVFGLDRTDDGVPLVDFRVCGPVAGVPVRTSMGASLIPDHGLDALEDADLIAIPALLIRDEYPQEIIDALRAAHARGAVLLSVCSGSFLLAEAGLVDGRRITTHWRHADELTARFPQVEVDPDVLFVDDGDIITSAGTAAGIDACLHIVRKEFGSAAANAIARRMVVPPQRDGGQRQYIDRPVPQCEEQSIREVLAWMDEHLDEPQTVEDLARRAHLSTRTFARTFVAETGTTPMQWLATQRVHHARTLLEESGLDLEEIARLSGFGSAALLRHHFRRAVGVPPTDYRQTFRHAS